MCLAAFGGVWSNPLQGRSLTTVPRDQKKELPFYPFFFFAFCSGFLFFATPPFFALFDFEVNFGRQALVKTAAQRREKMVPKNGHTAPEKVLERGCNI